MSRRRESQLRPIPESIAPIRRDERPKKHPRLVGAEYRLRGESGFRNWPNPTTAYKASGFRMDQPSTRQPGRPHRASCLRTRAMASARTSMAVTDSLQLMVSAITPIALFILDLFFPHM